MGSSVCLGYNGGLATLSQVPAIRLNLTLVEVEPPVWRELVVPGGWHLGKLHEVIQVAMGWENAHLHEFAAGELRWGPPDPLGFGDGPVVRREVTARLYEVLAGVGDVLSTPTPTTVGTTSGTSSYPWNC